MRPLDRGHLARLGEPLRPVLPEGLEHPVARLAARAALQQRLVGQRGEQVEHVRGLHRAAGADRLGGVRVTPPGKTATRSASAASASVSRSQLQSTTARSVWCRGSAVRLPPVSSRNRSSSRAATSVDRQRAQPGRGQLDGQRHAVEPAADLHHRADVVGVHREAGAHGGGPVGAAAAPPGRPAPRAGAASAAGRPSGGDRRQRLAGDRERLAAGGQDAQPRAAGQQLGRRCGAAASTRCSQLSSTSSARRSRQRVDAAGQRVGRVRLLPVAQARSPRPIAPSMACGTSARRR